jgi:hypothetical protein
LIRHGSAVGLALLVGVLARVAMLRSDYRQYPSYPHGYATHLFMGIFAALAGAVTIPALIEREWTAVTFFLLVAEQFRSIRSMERDSLKALEDNELVPRGSGYIEDIARVFETRYYIVIVVSAATALGFEMQSIWTGLLFGGIAFGWSIILTRGEKLGESVSVEAAPVIVKGSDVWVGDVYIFSAGLRESQEFIKERALGAILTPKDDEARDTLVSQGQRQAILHDAASILGARMDADTPEFAPQAKRDVKTDRVAIYTVPMVRDQEALLEIIRRSPVLESSRGRARFARAGRLARGGNSVTGRARVGGNSPEDDTGGRH